MGKVAAEAGTSFDPAIVHLLEKRYVELEKMVREKIAELAKATVNRRSFSQDVARTSPVSLADVATYGMTQ